VWGETWRILLAGTLGVLLLIAVYLDSESRLTQDRQDLITTIDLFGGLAGLVILSARRRWPLPAALGLTILTAVSASAVPAAGIAVISLAAHRRWRPLVAVAVPWVVSGFVYEMLRPSGTGPAAVATTLVISALSLGFAIAVGYYIGARRDLFASWRERAETAEREQASRVAQARANERARIAREMHDVLAHRISLVAMHSGALAYRTDLTPQETAEAAAIVRDNAHLALSELRDVLGVLRSVDDSGDFGGFGGSGPERPQPTLATLDELLSEARASGTDVDVQLSIEGLSSAPESLSRNGFRIVQEALTNARKHAPGEPVELGLSGRAGDGLTITVRNGIPTKGGTNPLPNPLPLSGMGLTGLTERAVLAGGTLTFGPDRRGDFVVHAWLPWAT
jgi:signal transduction histidine kinase